MIHLIVVLHHHKLDDPLVGRGVRWHVCISVRLLAPGHHLLQGILDSWARLGDPDVPVPDLLIELFDFTGRGCPLGFVFDNLPDLAIFGEVGVQDQLLFFLEFHGVCVLGCVEDL